MFRARVWVQVDQAPTLNPGQPLIFHCVHSFAVSRMPRSWNRTICSISCGLLSLSNVLLKFLPRLFVTCWALVSCQGANCLPTKGLDPTPWPEGPASRNPSPALGSNGTDVSRANVFVWWEATGQWNSPEGHGLVFRRNFSIFLCPETLISSLSRAVCLEALWGSGGRGEHRV